MSTRRTLNQADLPDQFHLETYDDGTAWINYPLSNGQAKRELLSDYVLHQQQKLPENMTIKFRANGAGPSNPKLVLEIEEVLTEPGTYIIVETTWEA